MSATFCLPRLALVLALSALPTPSLAQTPTAKPSPVASPSKDVILFDFESGNFDGWTLTGDCFSKSPATSKTFVDKQNNPVNRV